MEWIGLQEDVAPTSSSDRVCVVCGSGTFKAASGPGTCQAQRVCTSSEYETVAGTISSDRECAALRVCAADEWEEVAPTATSNRVCSPCGSCEAAGLTQASPCTATSPVACEGCDACSSGEYVSAACTATSQTECSTCSTCGAGEYRTQACGASQDTQCAALTVCGAGEYETRAPSTDADRECAALTVCGAGEFECTAATATSDRVCCAVSSCSAGEEVAKAATATSDRVCEACSAGTSDHDSQWQTPCVACGAGAYVAGGSTGACASHLCGAGTVDDDGLSSTPCAPCTAGVDFAPQAGLTVCWPVKECVAGEQEKTAPTQSTNRVCEVCPSGTFKSSAGVGPCTVASQCQAGEYVSNPHTTSTDTECSTVTVCGAGEYETRAPTGSSDRECGAVTVCSAGAEYEAIAPTATSNRVCSALTECDASGQWESRAPTATSDRECSACLQCDDATQYETAACTASGNRECAALTECTGAQFESTAPTATTDRQCHNLTMCLSSQFITAPATMSSDRKCLDKTICNLTSSFVSYEGDAYSDRACSPLTLCNPLLQFVLVNETRLTDRQCGVARVCSASEYETVALSRFADRQCSALTTCLATEVETKLPSSTSDRECASPSPLLNSTLSVLWQASVSSGFAAVEEDAVASLGADSAAATLRFLPSSAGVLSAVLSGSLQADSAFLAEPLPPARSDVQVLTDAVTVTQRTIFVWFSVRDELSGPSTEANATMHVEARQGGVAVAASSCAAAPPVGSCVAELVIPLATFSALSNQTVTDASISIWAADTAASTEALLAGTVSVFLPPAANDIADDVLVTLPMHVLESESAAEALVSAHTSFMLDVFRLKCSSLTDDLLIEDVVASSDSWTITVSSLSGHTVVVAGVFTGSGAAETGQEHLFSFTLRAAAGVPFASVQNASVACSVRELVDSAGYPRVPGGGLTFPTNATMRDRFGVHDTGLGRVIVTGRRGVLARAWAAQPCLFNVGALTGARTTTALTVIVLDQRGLPISGSPSDLVHCTATPGATLSPDCTNLELGLEVDAPVQVTVHLIGSVNVVPFVLNITVLQPQLPIRLELPTAPALPLLVPRRLSFEFGVREPCGEAHVFARAKVKASAVVRTLPWNASSLVVDITDLVLPLLVPENAPVVSILEDGHAVGQQAGSSLVLALRPSDEAILGQVLVNSTDRVSLEVNRLDVRVVSSATILVSEHRFASAISGDPLREFSAGLSVEEPAALTREGERAFVLVSAVLEDGTQFPLDIVEDAVFIESMDESVLKIAGPGIIEVSKGAGSALADLLRVTWYPPQLQGGVCVDPTSAGAIHNGSEHTYPMAVATVPLLVDVPDPVEMFVVGTKLPRLVTPADAASAWVPTSMSVRVFLGYGDDSAPQEATADERLEWTVIDEDGGADTAEVRVDGGFVVVTAGNPGRAIVKFTMQGMLPSIAADLHVHVTQSARVVTACYAYPWYPGSEMVPKADIRAIAGSSPLSFQSVEAHSMLVLEDGFEIRLPLERVSFSLVGSVNSTSSLMESDVGSVPELEVQPIELQGNIVRAHAPGTAAVRSEFGLLPTQDFVVVASVSDPVFVTGLNNLGLGAGAVLAGISGSEKTRVLLDVELSDGTVLLDFYAGGASLVPGLVTLTSNPPSAVALDQQSGAVTLVNNHHDQVELLVQASNVGDSAFPAGNGSLWNSTSVGAVSARTLFACNLEPEVGTADLGELLGVPLGPFTADASVLAAGLSVVVPIRVNIGTGVDLGAFGVRVQFSGNANVTVAEVRALFTGKMDVRVEANEVFAAGAVGSSGFAGPIVSLFELHLVAHSAGKLDTV